MRLIQQIRNEAHRFGIALHRKIRSKDALKSPLDEIKGIGPKTKEVLIKKFKSLKRIKSAQKNEIIGLLGQIKGENIYRKLKKL